MGSGAVGKPDTAVEVILAGLEMNFFRRGGSEEGSCGKEAD
jgi:hypothetical protein